MKTVLIIHGIGGHAGIHWQQWLRDELVAKGHPVIMPDMSDPDHPDRQTWLAEVKQAIADCEPSQLIIVGHSLGVTTALDYIEQISTNIGGLVAVSGFAEAYGFELNEAFLKEKNIDLDKVKQNIEWAEVIYGDNDPYVTQDALKYVAEALAVKPIVVENGGHLNTDAGFTEFPMVVEMIKRNN